MTRPALGTGNAPAQRLRDVLLRGTLPLPAGTASAPAGAAAALAPPPAPWARLRALPRPGLPAASAAASAHKGSDATGAAPASSACAEPGAAAADAAYMYLTKSEYLVGRDVDADIFLPDPLCSWAHLRVSRELLPPRSHWDRTRRYTTVFRDMSTNGTRINSEYIHHSEITYHGTRRFEIDILDNFYVIEILGGEEEEGENALQIDPILDGDDSNGYGDEPHVVPLPNSLNALGDAVPPEIDYGKRYPAAFASKYCILESKLLGTGSYARVNLAVKLSDLSRHAVKQISLRRIAQLERTTRVPLGDKIRDEVALLQAIAHPNIMRLHEYVPTATHAFIVCQYVDGGDLFAYLAERRGAGIAEYECKFIFFQLLLAVRYLHEEARVSHRDLKPENILVSRGVIGSDNLPRVYISDFGLARRIAPNTGAGTLDPSPPSRAPVAAENRDHPAMQTVCGTVMYLAPEVFQTERQLHLQRRQLAARRDPAACVTVQGYDEKVDCWSLGVILYALLSGFMPFDVANQPGEHIRELFRQEIAFPPSEWSAISPAAIDLIRDLLHVDPAERPSAGQALAAPWIASQRACLEKLYVKVVGDRAAAAAGTVPRRRLIAGSAAPKKRKLLRNEKAAQDDEGITDFFRAKKGGKSSSSSSK